MERSTERSEAVAVARGSAVATAAAVAPSALSEAAADVDSLLSNR